MTLKKIQKDTTLYLYTIIGIRYYSNIYSKIGYFLCKKCDITIFNWYIGAYSHKKFENNILNVN